jgi:predicted DNA-binding transcriptional regulator AlpA
MAAPRLKFRAPQAAEYLGVSASTLAKWRVRGDGPPYAKHGGVVIYDQSDVDNWLASLKRQSTSESPWAAGLHRDVERGGPRS